MQIVSHRELLSWDFIEPLQQIEFQTRGVELSSLQIKQRKIEQEKDENFPARPFRRLICVTAQQLLAPNVHVVGVCSVLFAKSNVLH